MDVSLIIVNYNTLQLTKDCINSVFEKTLGITFEIILVDNASLDGSKEFFKTDQRIKYYYLSENIGFGKANNFGIEKATGKYIFCLNNDTLLINNAIKLFFDYFEDKQNKNIPIGAVGCMLENKEGQFIHSYGSFPSIRKIILNRIIHPLYSIILGQSYKRQEQIRTSEQFVGYVTGADMFVNRELLNKYGAFDPDFFMYFEETELQFRLTKAGYKSMIISGPRIIHLEGASVKSRAYNSTQGRLTNKLIYNQQSEFIYMKKTHSHFSYYLYRILFFIIRIPFLLSLNKKERRTYFKILTK